MSLVAGAKVCFDGIICSYLQMLPWSYALLQLNIFSACMHKTNISLSASLLLVHKNMAELRIELGEGFTVFGSVCKF